MEIRETQCNEGAVISLYKYKFSVSLLGSELGPGHMHLQSIFSWAGLSLVNGADPGALAACPWSVWPGSLTLTHRRESPRVRPISHKTS